MRASAPGDDVIDLVCAGCGHRVPDETAFVTRCPEAVDGDDVDHVLRRVIVPGTIAFPLAQLPPAEPPPAELPRAEPPAKVIPTGYGPPGDSPFEPDPFVRFRRLFRGYHVARAAGWSDERYVGLVRRLDGAIAGVDGRGPHETPFAPADELGERLGFVAPGGVWVKDETGNVSGSHKARHLVGLMLELLVAEEVARERGSAGRPVPTDGLPSSPGAPAPAPALAPGVAPRASAAAPRLAIASCGNAALAAAVVARAANRALDVFVPTWADAAVVARLQDLGATVIACPRLPGEVGDPAYHRLRAAIAAGAIPFTCQGTESGLAIEGGQTLGYEIASRLVATGRRLDAIVVQVGGGALASAVAAALAEARALGALDREPRLYAVQAAGCAPLERAWSRLLERAAAEGLDAALAHAARHRSSYMRPWDAEPASAAHGILDDETYDWFAVAEAMARTGGRAVVVDEATILEANRLARAMTRIDADHTGTAGLAGLLELLRRGDVRPDESVAVLFTGVRRVDERGDAPGFGPGATSRHKERSAR